MSEHDKEQALLNAIKQRLDESESEIDPAALRQLRLARHAALDQLNNENEYTFGKHGLAAGVTVAMAAVVAVVGLQVMIPDNVGTTSPLLEDMNLLSASEELELYEELEFYQWLELEERTS